MTNLGNVADYLEREAARIYARIDRLEREGRATEAYLDRLEEAAECLEEAAANIKEYLEIKRSLTRRVFDVPPVPGRRPRVFREIICVAAERGTRETEEVGSR